MRERQGGERERGEGVETAPQTNSWSRFDRKQAWRIIITSAWHELNFIQAKKRIISFGERGPDFKKILISFFSPFRKITRSKKKISAIVGSDFFSDETIFGFRDKNRNRVENVAKAIFFHSNFLAVEKCCGVLIASQIVWLFLPVHILINIAKYHIMSWLRSTSWGPVL